MVTWTQGDIVDPRRRPGTYVNFTKKSQGVVRGGLIGIVAATVKAAWGPPQEVVEINSFADIQRVFSLEEGLFSAGLTDILANKFNAPFILDSILRGGANKILAQRLVGPATTGDVGKSIRTLEDTTGTAIDVITLRAKYPGVLGNQLTATVSNVAGASTQQIILRNDTGTILGRWTSTVDAGSSSGIVDNLIAIINADRSNTWVDAVKIADGNGTLAIAAAVNFSGGDGDEENIVIGDYTDAQSMFEREIFEYIYFDTDNTSIRNAGFAWVQSQRDNGKRVVMINGSSLAEDVDTAITNARSIADPSYIYVYPGAKRNNFDDDEVTYPGFMLAAQIVGEIAGLPLASSPTFQPVQSINDVEVRLNGDDIGKLLEGGVMPIIWDGARYKIERGINTLTEGFFSDHENEFYTKIKIIRILDYIANSIRMSIDDNFIGKIPNNDEGHRIIINSISAFLDNQVDGELIESNYTVEIDPDNMPTLDRFFLVIGIQPVDSLEFMYFTISVG